MAAPALAKAESGTNAQLLGRAAVTKIRVITRKVSNRVCLTGNGGEHHEHHDEEVDRDPARDTCLAHWSDDEYKNA